MPKSHPPYPPEYRAEAIRLVRSSGRPVAEIVRRLEVSTETLRLWVRQTDSDDGRRHDGLTTEETEEVRQLRRDVKRLREEREILVQAAAFFAPETGQTSR
jgi:transposase